MIKSHAHAATTGGAAVRVRRSLSFKIGGMLTLSLATAGLLTALLVSSQMRTMMNEEYRTKGVGIARGLATSIVPLLVRDDRSKIKASLDEFRKTDGIGYIILHDSNGQLISNSEGDAISPALLKAIIPESEPLQVEVSATVRQVAIADVGRYLDISFPVMNGALGRAHVGMDLNLIEQRLHDIGRAIGLEFVVFLILAMLGAQFFTQRLVRPIFAMMDVVVQVSTGDLNGRAEVNTQDEFLILSDSLNRMIGSLREIVASVSLASVQVNDASEEIVATARNQAGAVAEQVSGLEEITQTMSALTGTANAISEQAVSMKSLAQEMGKDVQRGQTALDSSRESMGQIVDQNGVTVDRINKLYEQSESIIAVIDIIDNISDRLDLLALNAALEGSRAGEVGKGFSLVAAEMRRLAENVSESTKEIKRTIQDIHGLVRAALDASNAGITASRAGVLEMAKTIETMFKVFNAAEQTAVATDRITIIVQQQVSSSQQVATAMHDVTAIATQSVQSAREVSKAATDLAGLSSGLQAQMAAFRGAGPAQGAEPGA